MDAKKLRILFVDDEDLDVISVFKKEGYDVEHWRDVESLDRLSDGRYHVVFLDVRGVGAQYGGNGLDLLKFLSVSNPLVFTVVFSAKPFNGAEGEVIRKYANRSLVKDVTFYELAEMLEEYGKSLTPENILKSLEGVVTVGWLARWKIRRGNVLSKSEIERIAKKSGILKDAVTITANVTTIAAALFKAINS